MNSTVVIAATAPPLAERSASDLSLRVASAAILAPLVLLVVYLGGVWFSLLVAAAAALLGWEWAKMCARDQQPGLGLMVPALALVITLVAAVYRFDIAVMILVAGTILIYAVAKLSGHEAPVWLAAGGAYIGLPILSLLWLRADEVFGREQVLWLLLVVWAVDIAAYLVGRAVGGPLLAPAISPKKTWSGVAGGLVGGAVTAVVVGLWAGATSIGLMIAAGIGVGIAAVLGDLLESYSKRHFAVKDSGALIPGHGGLFDRVDALLAAALVLAALQLITNHAGLGLS